MAATKSDHLKMCGHGPSVHQTLAVRKDSAAFSSVTWTTIVSCWADIYAHSPASTNLICGVEGGNEGGGRGEGEGGRGY